MLRRSVSTILVSLLSVASLHATPITFPTGGFDALAQLKDANRTISVNLPDTRLSTVFALLARSFRLDIRLRTKDRPIVIHKSATLKEILITLAIEHELAYEVRGPSSLLVTDSTVFEFGPLQVTRPTLVRELEPRFPKKAAQAGLSEATVVVEARIDLTGQPRDLKVLRCTQPEYGFEKAAINAVEKWRYLPAKVGEEPVEVYYTIVVRFDHEANGG